MQPTPLFFLRDAPQASFLALTSKTKLFHIIFKSASPLNFHNMAQVLAFSQDIQGPSLGANF